MNVKTKFIILILFIIVLIIPAFYLASYLDLVSGGWWGIGWIIFMIAVAIIARKIGLRKYIPQTHKYDLIHVLIPIVSLSAILIYVTITLQHFSLPLFLFFGGIIALIIVIYGIRLKMGK